MAALRALLKSEGWGLLVKQAEESTVMRNDVMQLTAGAEGVDLATKVAQARGEILGINHILGLPEALLDDIQQFIDDNVGEDGHVRSE